MRIAFDVKGTLMHQDDKGKFTPITKVVLLFHALQSLGHELTVWSNMLSFAVQAHDQLGFPNSVYVQTKKMNSDYYDLSEAFDIAIEDDHSQTWLGAKRIVFVDEIPDGDDQINRFAHALTTQLTEDEIPCKYCYGIIDKREHSCIHCAKPQREEESDTELLAGVDIATAEERLKRPPGTSIPGSGTKI